MEENSNAKKGPPRFYTDDERRHRKTDYMLHKPWYCDICNNGKNYTLAGKHCHLHTKKHFKNALIPMILQTWMIKNIRFNKR